MPFLLIFLISCVQTKSSAPISPWKVLQNVSPVDCQKIDIGEKFIRVHDAILVGDRKKAGMILQAVDRKGASSFYSVNLQSDWNLSDRKKKIESTTIGASLSGVNQDFWASSYYQGGDLKPELTVKIWSFTNETVYSEHKMQATEVGSANLTSQPQSPRLRKETTQGYLMTQINKASTNGELSRLKFKHAPMVLANRDNSLQYILSRARPIMGETPTNPKALGKTKVNHNFHFTTVRDQNKVETHLVPIPRLDAIEQWSASSHKDGFYLTLLSGDSFIGESRLHIASYQIIDHKIKRDWIYTFDLDDVHVGSFHWHIGATQDQHLLFFSWLDEEATLNTFRLARKRPFWLKNNGIFPAKSSLQGLMSQGQGNVAALVKYIHNNYQEFGLCPLQFLNKKT